MKFKKVKKYTVNTKTATGEDGKLYVVFTNLLKAREFAREQFRAGNFKSLLNFKRIPLTI